MKVNDVAGNQGVQCGAVTVAAIEEEIKGGDEEEIAIVVPTEPSPADL